MHRFGSAALLLLVVLAVAPPLAAAPPSAGATAVRHLQIDVSAAVRMPLLRTEVDDEGTRALSAPGTQFVLLPFPLAPFAELDRDLQVGGGTLEVRTDRPKHGKVIGFLVGAVREGALTGLAAGQPVYEKLLVKPGGGGKLTAEAVNTSRPRRGSASARSSAPRSARQTLSATDWVVLVVQVEEQAKTVDVALHKEAAESIDLKYLATASQALPISDRTTGSEAAVAETLARTGDSSAPMAVLAVERVRGVRERFSARTKPELVRAVAQALAVGLAHDELRVRRAAWAALAGPPEVAEAERAAIQSAGTAAARAIADLAVEQLRGASEARRRNMLRLLNAAWAGEDAQACRRVLDAVVADGRADAFAALERATRAGLDEMFSRASASRDPTARAGLLRALVGQTPVEREPEWLAAARELRLEIVDPADRILERFAAANDPREKAAILRALTHVSALPIHATAAFDRFVEQATDSKGDLAVREAAFEMVLAQARMGIEADAPDAFGAYPLGVPSGGLDGLTTGLCRATASSAPQTSLQAWRALLLRGDWPAAVDTFRAARLPPDAAAALLGKLCTDAALRQADGLAAFLIAAAGKADRKLAAVVLRQLGTLGQEYPAAQRWRLASAARCGMEFQRFVGLACDRDAGVSGPAMLWINTVSGGKGASAPASRESAELTAMLGERHQQAYQRPAQRYGCLLVLETSEALDPVRFGAASVVRWSMPRRKTWFGPIVHWQSRDGTVVLAAAGQPVGGGRPAAAAAALPDARTWPAALRATTWKMNGVGFDARGRVLQHAPLALPGGVLLEGEAEGALNIDAAPLIRAALGARTDDAARQLEKIVPESRKLTLRPVGFGAWAGTAPSEPPPEKAPAAGRILLNVMVVIEPIE